MNLPSIANLSSLIKSVVEITGKAWNLANRNENVDQKLVNFTKELERSFRFRQDQINYLSLQISQIENIIDMLSLWIEEINQLENEILILNLDNLSILDLCPEFESFLYRSTLDYFSSIFYEKSFDKLFGVNEKINGVRISLTALKITIRAVPSKDSESWQTYLHIIKFRLNNLKRKGSDLNCHCINLRVKLINELEEINNKN